MTASDSTGNYVEAIDAVTHALTSVRIAGAAGGGIAIRPEDEPAVMPSGNTVQLEDELLKAGEVRRAFEMNTAIVKAFHRMMLMTTKA